MRTVVIAALFALGCGGAPKPPPAETATATATAEPRLDLHCTPQADFDEAACAGRGAGCGYGPPLICRGVDVPDEVKEEERRAYEAGTGPCECICEEARVQCMMVP
jgi:hypothetical protein